MQKAARLICKVRQLKKLDSSLKMPKINRKSFLEKFGSIIGLKFVKNSSPDSLRFFCSTMKSKEQEILIVVIEAERTEPVKIIGQTTASPERNSRLEYHRLFTNASFR